MTALTEHLTLLADWNATVRETPEGWKYGSYEALVVTEGTVWADPNKIALDNNGPLKNCYENSLTYAMENGMLYCEGYAQGSIIPVQHAWVYNDETDEVIETTWTEPGAEYIGVPMDPYEAGAAMVKAGYYGLLANDWLAENQLLKEGFPDQGEWDNEI